jgi:hypothetical protein
MIGFESDTIEPEGGHPRSFCRPEAGHHPDLCITPLPQTPLWDEIVEKYGIWDHDYHNYDGKHMVWNHPHIKPEEFQDILDWSFKQTYSWATPIRTSGRVWANAYRYGGLTGVKEVAAYITRANKFDWNQGLRLLKVG